MDIGYLIYNSLEDFRNNDFLGGLSSDYDYYNPASAIWAHPTTGDIYRIVSALEIIDYDAPDDSNGPVTFVEKWNGSAFVAHATIQEPGPTNSASISWETTPSSATNRYDSTAIFVGQPYVISQDRWLISVPSQTPEKLGVGFLHLLHALRLHPILTFLLLVEIL
jgi:hypothetical protein